MGKMNKYIKIALISLGVLVFLVFILYYTGILGYMAMNVDNYDYNPPLKHEDYSNFKLSIPYELVPLVPSKIGLKKDSYYQLKNIDTNLDYYTYVKLDYNSFFKTNEFDRYSFEVDDSNYVVSFLLFKEKNINDILEFKENLKNNLLILENFYGKNYELFYSKIDQKFNIRWSTKEYIVYLSTTNYLVNKKPKKVFYNINFSKVNTKIEELFYLYEIRDYREVNKNYLEKLGLK